MNATAAAAVLLVVRLAVMEAAAEDVFCAANLSVFFVNWRTWKKKKRTQALHIIK